MAGDEFMEVVEGRGGWTGEGTWKKGGCGEKSVERGKERWKKNIIINILLI